MTIRYVSEYRLPFMSALSNTRLDLLSLFSATNVRVHFSLIHICSKRLSARLDGKTDFPANQEHGNGILSMLKGAWRRIM